MTFGLTVQEVIDALSKLDDFEKSMYLVDHNDVPFNIISSHWSRKKYLGNCIQMKATQINWNQNDSTIASTLPAVGKG